MDLFFVTTPGWGPTGGLDVGQAFQVASRIVLNGHVQLNTRLRLVQESTGCMDEIFGRGGNIPREVSNDQGG